MSKKKENSFLMQGAILAATALITKIIGLAYRIPVTNIMGAEGNGYYGMVFQVYNLALMLTSYSLPTAVSKLVSARVATGQYRNAYRVFRGAMTFAIIAGGIVTAIVFFGAGFIATDIMKMDLSVYALRVLAPCILVVAFLGVFRGFFQGFGTMIPTAVSQTVADHQCDRKYCWRIHVIKGWTEFRIRSRQEILWSSLRSSRCNIGNGCRCTGCPGIFDSFILCL